MLLCWILKYRHHDLRMTELPLPIREFLQTLTEDRRPPAYLLVDESGLLVACGGDLATYGVVGLQDGADVTQRVPFLAGLLPPDPGEVIFLPYVQTVGESFADIYVFRREQRTWVVLLDATREAVARQRVQQRANELDMEVTQLKWDEEALSEENAELERRVAERTAQLVRVNLRLRRELDEREKAERALRANEERLAMAQEAGRVAAFELIPDQRRSKWSKELEALYGLAPGQHDGTYEAWLNRVHPEDRQRAHEDFERALVIGMYPTEFRVVWPDGTVRWLHGRGKVEYDEERRPVRVLGVSVDVTERKRAEEQLSLLQTITTEVASSENLASALKVVLRRVCEKTGWSIGQVWLPRQDETVLECGPAWGCGDIELKKFRDVSKRLNFPPGVNLPGRVWLSKQPRWITDVTQDPNFLRAQVAKEMGLKAALAIPILSGEKVIAVIEYFLRLPRAEDERLVQVITAVAKQLGLVIERKRAEEARRVSDDRYRDLVENSQELICTHDLAGTIILVNPWAARILGYEQNALVRMSIRDWLAPEYRDEFDEYLVTIKREGFAKGIMQIQTAAGERRFWEYHNTLRTEGIREPVVRAMAHDITERMRDEEALRRSNEQIQDLAGRLITAQEEERRRIARELHDDLNQKLGALAIDLSNLTRQIDDPARGKLTSLQQRTVEIAESVRRLSHELHPAILEHIGLVAALSSYCAEFSRDRGISVDLSIPERLTPVSSVVALCLYRVTQEALWNVAKHSGATRARVSLAEVDGVIELVVDDAGKGFDADRVWHKAGLGLVSIEERVRLVRGSWKISTKPGLGTELRLYVPLEVRQ
jgi:PAS domain S-box-containing protein